MATERAYYTFNRCLQEYNQLKIIKIQTINTKDCNYSDGASEANHSNIIDIRSGNPSKQVLYI